jgi:hypothetical protein
MRRSEAIKKLIPFVINKAEIIDKSLYDSGVYHNRAERLLTFIEKELKMKPPLTERQQQTLDEGPYDLEGKWEPEG